MPGTASLQVLIDVPEPRNLTDRQVVLVDGRGWDALNCGSVSYMDRITNTAMLLPLPASPEWGSVFTGNYRRYGTADYSGLTAGRWQENNVGTAGNIYLQLMGTVAEPCQTVGTFPINQPWYLSYFSFGTGEGQRLELQCGWGTVGGTAMSLNIYSTGNVDLLRGGSVVGQYHLRGDKGYDPRYGPSAYVQYEQHQGDRIGVYLIPCRQRELLVFSTLGGGFSHVCADLPAGTIGTVAPAGKFWWNVPSGAAQVQLAPMRFGTASYLLSPVGTLAYPPGAGTSPTGKIWWDGPGYGSVVGATSFQKSNGAPWVSDGTTVAYRLRVDMVGDGSATPFVYAAEAKFAAGTVNSWDGTYDLTPYICSDPPPHLEVSEGPDGTQFTCTVSAPEEIETVGSVNFFRVLANRSCEVRFGSVTLIKGRCDAPAWDEGISDDARRLTFTIHDRWKALEGYRFTDGNIEPISGQNLGTAYANLVMLPGYGTADVNIQATTTFNLDETPAIAAGAWNLIPQPGDTAADWLKKLWTDYDRAAVIGFQPGSANSYQFARRGGVGGGAGIGTVALGTIFPTAGSTGANGTIENTYRAYRQQPTEPEANDIFVSGIDPATMARFQVHLFDTTSQDPTTPGSVRATNWLGEIRSYGLLDSAIVTPAMANRAALILSDRLSVTRWNDVWESTLLMRPDGLPYWRGDMIFLAELGRYQILSFGCDFIAEDSGGFLYRSARYTGWFRGSV